MSAPRTAFPGIDLRGLGGHRHGRRIGHRQETALSLADLGADVAVLDVDGPAAERTAAEIAAIGRTVHRRRRSTSRPRPACAPRSRPAARRSAMPTSRSRAPGILGDFQAIDVTSVEHFDRVMAVNVRGSFLTIREAVPQMRRRGHGAVHRAVEPRRAPGRERHGVVLHVQGRPAQPRPGRVAWTSRWSTSRSMPCAPA